MLAERKKSIFNISYLVLYKKHLCYTCIGHIGKRKINSFTSKNSNRSILLPNITINIDKYGHECSKKNTKYSVTPIKTGSASIQFI